MRNRKMTLWIIGLSIVLLMMTGCQSSASQLANYEKLIEEVRGGQYELPSIIESAIELENKPNEDGMLYFMIDDHGINKYGFINVYSGFIIEPRFFAIKEDENGSFTSGTMAVENESGWDFINVKGEYVTNGHYDDIFNYRHGYAVVEKDEEFFIINDKFKQMNKDGFSEFIDESLHGYSFKNGDKYVEFIFSSGEFFETNNHIVFDDIKTRYEISIFGDEVSSFGYEVSLTSSETNIYYKDGSLLDTLKGKMVCRFTDGDIDYAVFEHEDKKALVALRKDRFDYVTDFVYSDLNLKGQGLFYKRGSETGVLTNDGYEIPVDDVMEIGKTTLNGQPIMPVKIMYDKNEYMFVDRDGHDLYDSPLYYATDFSKGGYAVAIVDTKGALINQDKEVLYQPECSMMMLAQNNFMIFDTGKEESIVNISTGKVLGEGYDDIKVEEDKIYLYRDEMTSVMDFEGNLLLKPRLGYDKDLEPFGRLKRKSLKGYEYICDKNGNRLSNSYMDIYSPDKNGNMIILKGYGQGLIDINGEVLIAPSDYYKSTYVFNDGKHGFVEQELNGACIVRIVDIEN